MINFKHVLKPHWFNMKPIPKCACFWAEMGSEDVGWKSCPAPTYAAENLTTCSTTKHDAEVEGVPV